MKATRILRPLRPKRWPLPTTELATPAKAAAISPKSMKTITTGLRCPVAHTIRTIALLFMKRVML